jgi:hypothetical protein
MRTRNQPQTGQKLLVLILHDNLDFSRDLAKRLCSRGIECRSFCERNGNRPSDVIDHEIIFVIDINILERHLRVLRRMLRSRAVEERLFYVNAERYDKGDWAKINTYCEMITVQDRLWRASRA